MRDIRSSCLLSYLCAFLTAHRTHNRFIDWSKLWQWETKSLWIEDTGYVLLWMIFRLIDSFFNRSDASNAEEEWKNRLSKCKRKSKWWNWMEIKRDRERINENTSQATFNFYLFIFLAFRSMSMMHWDENERWLSHEWFYVI